MKTTKQAIAIIRVASSKELKECRSYVDQYQQIHEYADHNNTKIEHIFDNLEVKSNLLHEALEYCRTYSEINSVLVTNFHRISRDVNEFVTMREAFKSLDVNIISVNEPTDDSPEGKFMENMYTLLSQAHSEEHLTRVKKGMGQRASQGYAVHQPPIGYAPSSTPGLYKKTKTAKNLARYFKAVLNGTMTVTELQRAISKVYSPSAKICKKHLIHICSNPYYSGYISYKGELYDGLHEPILTPFEQVQLIEIVKG